MIEVLRGEEREESSQRRQILVGGKVQALILQIILNLVAPPWVVNMVFHVLAIWSGTSHMTFHLADAIRDIDKISQCQDKPGMTSLSQARMKDPESQSEIPTEVPGPISKDCGSSMASQCRSPPRRRTKMDLSQVNGIFTLRLPRQCLH